MVSNKQYTALEGVYANAFTDGDDVRKVNDAGGGAITVQVDNGGFNALRQSTPKPRISFIDAAAVDTDKDDAAAASRKLSAASLLLTFLQFAVMPAAIWRGISRLITGSSSNDALAGEHWLSTLPDQLRSIYGMARIAAKDPSLSKNVELWNACSAIWNTIKESKSNTALRITHAAKMLNVQIGVQGLRALWGRGWYVANVADGELANKGGQRTTIRYDAKERRLTVTGQPLTPTDVTRSNAVVLQVLAGYDDWSSVPEHLQAVINKGVNLNFNEWSLANLLSTDPSPGADPGKGEATEPQTSAGDALAQSSDVNFRATLQHFLSDVIDIIESTTDDETDAIRTINAVPMFVGKLANDAKPLSSDDIEELRDAIQTQHLEMGGIEEGFFPMLLAAAPAIASLLSSAGGGKKGGGGGGGIMSLLSKLPLGRLLFGKKKEKKEKHEHHEEPPKLDDDAPLTVGALKLLLKGLNSPQKETGAYLPEPAMWEDSPGSFARVEKGFLEGLLLGSLLRKKGRKKKKKRGGGGAPAPSFEQMYEERRQQEEERDRRRDEEAERRERLAQEDEDRRERERSLREREDYIRRMEEGRRLEAARDMSLGYADEARAYESRQLPAPIANPDALNPALADMYPAGPNVPAVQAPPQQQVPPPQPSNPGWMGA